MKGWPTLAGAILPWLGLVIGVLAAGFVHQFGSDSTFDHCRTASPGPVLVVAVLGLIACLASGFASWRSIHGVANDARRIAGIISVGMALLFAFAILLPMIAALMLPPCFG